MQCVCACVCVCVCVMQVDKAMFPLNLYPTHDELKEMHEQYAQNRTRVDLAEFITMVGWLVGWLVMVGWLVGWYASLSYWDGWGM